MNTNNEIIESLKQIAAEKNLKMDVVLDTLKTGLLTAAMKSYGTSENLSVKVDHNTAKIEIWATKKVVEEVLDPRFEISLSDARKLDPEAGMGQEVNQPLNFRDFGRNAIQTIKQILIQRTREAERDNIFDNYKHRVGEVVSCVVQQVIRGDLIVLIGKVEAILPRREQVKSERYYRSDTLRAMVLEVQKTSKGPQIVLTRNHSDFVKRLFEIEVPEIYEKIVEIKTVSREAGERTKIAVYSGDDKIDALGACVGMKGIRIQSVVRELNNEKVDIIPWSEDVIELTERAMSPAKVNRIIVNPRLQNSLYVIVNEDQLSIAIGKNGQNVKLASKLVNRDIDLLTEDEYADEQERIARSEEPIADFEGLGKEEKQALGAAGLSLLAEVEKKSIPDLVAILGDKTVAEEVFKAVDEYINGPEEEAPAADEPPVEAQGTETPAGAGEALDTQEPEAPSEEEAEANGPEPEAPADETSGKER